MNRSQIYDAADGYVNLAIRLLNKQRPTKDDRQRIRSAGVHLLHCIDSWRPDNVRATAGMKASADARRATEPFTITWRSTGKVEEIAGWDKLASRLNYTPGTIRVLLSKGRGQHTMDLYDEDLGTSESVVIKRVNYISGTGRPKGTHKEE